VAIADRRSGRITAAAVAASFLVGCLPLHPPGDAVELLVGGPSFTVPNERGETGCFTYAVIGDLVVDPTYGTAIDIGAKYANGNPAPPEPVIWPEGFTGRRVGSEVMVLDRGGQVVAITGRVYDIEGGHWTHASGVSGFVSCGFVNQQ
jgi:hypothetical protein